MKNGFGVGGRHENGEFRREGDGRRYGNGNGRAPPPQQQQPPRERSLSPYSKRLALTQAMNMGR